MFKRAHVGVPTRVNDGTDESLDAFLYRQRERVRARVQHSVERYRRRLVDDPSPQRDVKIDLVLDRRGYTYGGAGPYKPNAD